MARTALTATALPTGYTTALVATTAQAVDNTNGNLVPLTGREHLVFINTTGGAITVTISSVAAASNSRTGNITTISVPATTGILITQKFPLDGWQQTDGNLYIDASATGLKVLVLQDPS